uniref:Uncharacterized protein n=1 Tax=Anopheles dirus TaxID=7168 RepID=A0A182N9J1_9DIPT
MAFFKSLVCLAVLGVAAAGVVPLHTEYEGDYYTVVSHAAPAVYATHHAAPAVYASHAYAPAHGTVEYHGKAAAPLAYYHH